jgi:hypothetical protein
MPFRPVLVARSFCGEYHRSFLACGALALRVVSLLSQPARDRSTFNRTRQLGALSRFPHKPIITNESVAGHARLSESRR